MTQEPIIYYIDSAYAAIDEKLGDMLKSLTTLHATPLIPALMVSTCAPTHAVWRPAIEVLQNDIPAATFFHEPNGLMAMARAPAVTENANIVILSHVLVDFLSPDEAQQFWESLEAEIGSRPAVILVIEGFKYLEKYVQTPRFVRPCSTDTS